jgi:hypothetical protein
MQDHRATAKDAWASLAKLVSISASPPFGRRGLSKLKMFLSVPFVCLVVGVVTPAKAKDHSAPVDRPHVVDEEGLGPRAACGYEQVTVSGASRRELAEVCKALGEVLAYFQGIGFRFEPKFSLYFRTGASADAVDSLRAHGYFDRRSSKINIFKGPRHRPWGLKGTPEIAASFLRHEMVHMALLRVLGNDYERIRKVWHEFIAYAVQIDLMPSSLRERILSRYPTTMAFASQEAVNEFTYGADTSQFSISAFKSYKANGGAQFVKKLIRFEIVPQPMPAIFLEMLLEQKRGARN